MKLAPPPTPPPLIQTHTNKKGGICFHVDKPCFKLEPMKNVKQKKDNGFRTAYYIQRIKNVAKTARDPDMNMSLHEIQTGVKTSDRMKMSLFVYLLGVLFIFLNL